MVALVVLSIAYVQKCREYDQHTLEAAARIQSQEALLVELSTQREAQSGIKDIRKCIDRLADLSNDMLVPTADKWTQQDVSDDVIRNLWEISAYNLDDIRTAIVLSDREVIDRRRHVSELNYWAAYAMIIRFVLNVPDDLNEKGALPGYYGWGGHADKSRAVWPLSFRNGPRAVFIGSLTWMGLPYEFLREFDHYRSRFGRRDLSRYRYSPQQ